MKNWAVLSDEQMSNRWPYSLLNDEQMSNKVRVVSTNQKRSEAFFGVSIMLSCASFVVSLNEQFGNDHFPY